MLEVYYVNGIILNRNNEPAYIQYYNNGNIKQEKYYAAENRNFWYDSPFLIREYNINGELIEEKHL